MDATRELDTLCQTLAPRVQRGGLRALSEPERTVFLVASLALVGCSKALPEATDVRGPRVLGVIVHAQGDATRALATLDAYDRSYAQKQFGPEALALRVQALRASGQEGRARALAREFEQRYPHHPLLSRVQNR